MPTHLTNRLSILFTLSSILLNFVPTNGMHLQYGDYYRYPTFNRAQANYEYPQANGARVGALQPLNRPPYGTVYWPPAMLNAQGQTTGEMVDNRSSFGQPIQPVQPQQFGNQLSGYGSNMGVYAGIQSQQNGYNYNYNTNGQQGQQNAQVYGQQQTYGRPYGPDNSNVGGSYGGLSQWPFVQPIPQKGSTTTGQITVSTIARPTQASTTNNEQPVEVAAVGTVQTLSLQDLAETR